MRYISKSRFFDKLLISLMFKCLGRTMRGVVQFDKYGKTYLNELNNGFVFRLTIHPKGPSIVLKKQADNLVKVKKRDRKAIKPNLDVQFKNAKVAMPVILGKSGIAQSYAESRIIVYGDISDSMRVVDIINLTESYLFPKFIIQHFMNNIPKRDKSMLRGYLALIFGSRVKKES